MRDAMGSSSAPDRCEGLNAVAELGSDLKSLLKLLRRTSSELQAGHDEAEEHGLEQVAMLLVDGRDNLGSISSDESSHSHHLVLLDLFRVLIQNRLLSRAYRLPPTDADCVHAASLHRVLQCTRLFMRDQRFVRELVKIDGSITTLGAKYKEYALLCLAESERESSVKGQGRLRFEILSEVASIFKKLASHGATCPWHFLVECNAHRTAMSLMCTQEPSLLASALMTLSSIASRSEESAAIIGQLGCADRLLLILREHDTAFQHLASDLLQSICRVQENRRRTQKLGGVSVTLGLLGRNIHAAALESFLRLFSVLLSERFAATEARSRGAVPILLSMLIPGGVSDMDAGDPRVRDPPVTCLICSLLSKLSADDEGAFQIRQCNGVYLLGRLLTDTHALHVSKRMDDILQSMLEIQTHTFRALRFVFSSERNRKLFKCIFPANLYEIFIDVGHYRHDIGEYRHVAQNWCDLTPDIVRSSLSALEDINFQGDHRKGSQKIINGYIMAELIGAGAFGRVHRVYKARDIASQYAMKELDPGVEKLIFGESPDEISASVGRVAMEVQIFSQLDHPNIVKYYESFTEGCRLYIIMELVEGVSLLDFINSTSEKNQRISEESIWDIFMQIVQALNYMHIKKGVVHRDLSPSNILLEHGSQRVKLADFGLAKAHNGDWSKRRRDELVMQSAVGTIAFSSPEIIMHEPYGDKVDVWSLGCILYYMLALHPPFEGPNPLVIASAIVEGRYGSLDVLVRRKPAQVTPQFESKRNANRYQIDKKCSASSAVAACAKGGYYSTALVGLVGRLLAIDPSNRPSIIEVAAACAPYLMRSVDQMQSLNDKLQVKLRYLRECGHLEGVLEHRKQEAIRQLQGLTRRTTERMIRHASSCSLETHDELNDKQSSFAGMPNTDAVDPYTYSPQLGSVPSSSRSRSCNFKISSERLRPIADPLLQVITALHKLVYIDQLPSDIMGDSRSVLQHYKRHIFGARQSAATIKAEVVKLLSRSREIVKVQDTSLLREAREYESKVDCGRELTYNDLGSMLEEVLLSHNFYNGMK